MRRLALAAIAVFALASCDPERGTVRVVRTSTFRIKKDSGAPSEDVNKVVLDIDVEAHEGLGGNVGRYCMSVLWPFAPSYVEQCGSDLSDGDTKSFRFTSERTDHRFNDIIRVAAFTGNARTGAEDVRVP